MTVIVDLKDDNVQVQGDVDELGDLTTSGDSYIDMFKNQAKFFIDNNISNPKKPYDELINNQSINLPKQTGALLQEGVKHFFLLNKRISLVEEGLSSRLSN
ncbi:hypothetical protein [Psychrobacillus sp. OK032]|uniref:hypothetical protein n=1 Tax=Psychrobacillus sp. OK032 TaxID=1884358 RepID=UPI0008B06BCB|nr:hypothetical protein [Psychrobacillus sp. OK032]SER51333.1 hypothetical protein SAMN05518872_1018 [Psychrobacillus sp. OK032]